MIYVPKPAPVEACKFDSQGAALGWLQPGEFSVVEKDAVHIAVEARTHTRVPLDGSKYVTRIEGRLSVVDAEVFEEDYMPMSLMDNCEFMAEGDPDDGWVISCTACGLIGHARTEEDLPTIALEHIQEGHGA